MTEHKQQAKLIVRRLSPNSEPLCSIESGAYTLQWVLSSFSGRLRLADLAFDVCFFRGFSYLVAGSVIYLVITDKSYPRKMAFAYLDELAKEFDKLYGPKVDSTTRPYAFVGFGQSAAHPFPARPRTDSQPCSPLLRPFADNFMSKTTRQYKDSRSAPPPSANEGGPAGNLSKINEELQDVTRIMTKNMEDLLWRGDSLDRTAPFLLSSSNSLLLAVMLMESALLVANRNVGLVDVAALGIAQVPQAGPKHQPRAPHPPVRPLWSRRPVHHRLHLVEVLLRKKEGWGRETDELYDMAKDP